MLTVGVVTKPFTFEGKVRMRNAEIGIAALKPIVDTLITIPNDKLIDLVGRASLPDALRVADDVLRQGIQGISDLIAVPAMINLDFADVKTIMKEKGLAHMGIGSANGEKRAAEAARQAIESPMLETSINGARGVLMNITGGPDLSLLEVNEAAEIIAESADPEANIIFGADIDEAMGDSLRITVIATGFESERTIPQAPAGSMFGGGSIFTQFRLPTAAATAGRALPAVPVPHGRAAAAAAPAAAVQLRGVCAAPPGRGGGAGARGRAAGQRRRLWRERPQARLQRKAQEQAGRARVPAQISAAAVRQDRSPSKRPARTPGGAFAAGRPQTPL